MSDGADYLGGGEEPGDDTGEGDDDSNEQENSHALVSIESPVTHLDKHVGQHPERDADTEYGQGDDHQGPGPSNEGLVGGNDGHVSRGPSGGGGDVRQPRASVQTLYGPRMDRSVCVPGIDQRGG